LEETLVGETGIGGNKLAEATPTLVVLGGESWEMAIQRRISNVQQDDQTAGDRSSIAISHCLVILLARGWRNGKITYPLRFFFSAPV
jgi:hypothetical protein